MRKKLLALALAGLLTFSAASSALADSKSEAPTDIEFELTVNGVTKEVSLSQLGVSATESNEESEEPENLAFILSWFGRTSLLDGLLSKETTYDFTWSELRSEDTLRNLWDLDRPKNARFYENEGVLNIEAEQEGVDFDMQTLLEEITNDYPRFDDYELEVSEKDVVRADELVEHFGQVQDLLEKGLTVNVSNESYSFPAQLKDIVVSQESGAVQVELNTPYMTYVINTLGQLTHSESSDMLISEAPEGLGQARIEGYVKNGQTLDGELTAKMIAGSISSGETDATGIVDVEKGEVLNQSGLDLGDLDLLSTGLSDFSTSPYGRDFNVRKALNEHYNGIIIPAGESFHFNDFLGPVTYSAGWAGSLAIFNGNDLREVPGGGVCQVSTTVYRAALNAGLDIEQQRNHSLYIHYYEAHGDGQDSTIYPGVQDLVFKNNTDYPILIEAYAEGTDAIVNFYGTSDGRSVELRGPFTQSNQDESVIAGTGGLGYNQIAWQQIVSWPDGRVEDDWRISTYNGSVTQY